MKGRKDFLTRWVLVLFLSFFGLLTLEYRERHWALAPDAALTAPYV